MKKLKKLARQYLDALEGDKYERQGAYAALASEYWRQHGEHLWRSSAGRIAKEILAND